MFLIIRISCSFVGYNLNLKDLFIIILHSISLKIFYINYSINIFIKILLFIYFEFGDTPHHPPKGRCLHLG